MLQAENLLKSGEFASVTVWNRTASKVRDVVQQNQCNSHGLMQRHAVLPGNGVRLLSFVAFVHIQRIAFHGHVLAICCALHVNMSTCSQGRLKVFSAFRNSGQNMWVRVTWPVVRCTEGEGCKGRCNTSRGGEELLDHIWYAGRPRGCTGSR